ncbi:MAG: hypothetical protein NC131_19565, partial [Roseburia sp.]|nr:hypothetical protein [Roseburia sp.]
MNKLTEFVCSHCNNRSGACCGYKTGENCKYEVCSREELVKRIVIAERYAQDEIDEAELAEMVQVFRDKYNGYRYDIYQYKLHHKVCGHCDGCGTVIEAHAITDCKKCNGTGIINREPRSSQYTTLWFKFLRNRGEDDVSSRYVNMLYLTRDAVESAVKRMNREAGKRGDKWEIGELLISKNILSRRNDQLTEAERAMKKYIDAEDELAELVALTESEDGYKIVAFGSWADLHESRFGYIAPYLDIEQIMNGKTVL